MKRSGLLVLIAILLASFVVIGAGPNHSKAKGKGKGPQQEFVEEVFIEVGGQSHPGPGPHPTTEWNKFTLIQGGVRWHDGADVE